MLGGKMTNNFRIDSVGLNLQLKQLLTELYKTAEKIGEVGIHDVTSCDYVRMWVNDEKKVHKLFKTQAQRISELEAALKEIVDDIEKCPEISANSSVIRLAKKALGDCIPNTTTK